MPKPSSKTPHSIAFQIATTAQNPVESPEHKRFKTLLAKIKVARRRLQSWQLQLPLFAQGYQERATPLLQRMQQLKRAWVFELASLHDSRPLSAKDKNTLAEVICDIAGEILEAEDELAKMPPAPASTDHITAEESARSNAALKALYNRFAKTDFDSDTLDELNDMKRFMETVGGLDLGDQPVESVEELMRRAHEEMQRRTPAGGSGTFGEGLFGEGLFGEDPFGPTNARAARKGSGRSKAQAKISAAQRRAEEDAKKVSQTVREVYRKLAAALHPDRSEPGASALQLKERTDLMAQANTAYEAGDLLALLNLQLQIEQVDAAHVAEVTAVQVKHFNKVLAEQLRELQAESEQRENAFCASYGIMVHTTLHPEKLGELLNDVVRDLGYSVLGLQHQRQLVQASVTHLKRWLKDERRERKEDAEWDAQMDNLF